MTRATLRFPFDLIHKLAENSIVAGLTKYLVNWNVPVTSKTMESPRQNRFRLDYKGNILDFDRMTKEQMEAYANDEIEQERQSSPGMRHRNHETIRCRFMYITNRTKMIESLERIRNQTKRPPEKLSYYTARKIPYSEINNNTIPSKPNLNDYYQNANPEKKLVLFLHGGGFFCLSSRSYEIYLKKLVNQLGSIPLLTVDYSLTVPYPIALQEVLDVYLWLLSGREDVKQMLGFHPKKIVLAGDSGGGFLSLTLTILLNELNKTLNKSNETNGYTACRSIPLPVSLVLAYPAINMSNLSASLCMANFELVVQPHALMLVMSLFGSNLSTVGDFKRIENGELFFANRKSPFRRPT